MLTGPEHRILDDIGVPIGTMQVRLDGGVFRTTLSFGIREPRTSEAVFAAMQAVLRAAGFRIEVWPSDG